MNLLLAVAVVPAPQVPRGVLSEGDTRLSTSVQQIPQLRTAQVRPVVPQRPLRPLPFGQ